jgi:Core-2/I-Branching enzyme
MEQGGHTCARRTLDCLPNCRRPLMARIQMIAAGIPALNALNALRLASRKDRREHRDVTLEGCGFGEPATRVQHDATSLRIAYFITSYGAGAQLLRLVRTLKNADRSSVIVIHHDSFQSRLDEELFDAIPDVHILTGDEPIVWGDLTLESARWRVFRWILDSLQADWVMLLSEQDYPIAPLGILRSRLSHVGVDAFIDGRRIDSAENDSRYEYERRYMYQYSRVPFVRSGSQLVRRWKSHSDTRGRKVTRSAGTARQGSSVRRLAVRAVRAQQLVRYYRPPRSLNLPDKIGFRAWKTPFSSEFPCWYNNSWMALSRKAIEHVIHFLDDHPEFIRYYDRTIIPVESATATILFNDPEINVVNAPLHAIRWSDPRSGRPDCLSVDDVEFLCSSGAVFARKFKASDYRILDELDAVVLASPNGP